MKVLVKLQVVCKQWYAIVQDRHFIERHMSRGTLRAIINKIPSSPPTHETFQLICGCDGLLLRKSNVSHKYHIKNPTTHQILELPDPKKTTLAMTFSFVRSTSEYKLVSTYDDETDRNGAFCEVLTVGRDNLWKPLKMPNLNDVDKKRDRISVVSTDSAVHCFQICKIGSKFSQEVVSLDLGTECFTITTLPNDLYQDWEKVWALNWSGKLAFADIVKEELQVLVLEDYKKHKWSETKTIVPLAYMNKEGYLKADLVPLIADSGTVWFWLKDKTIFSYNMKTGCIGKKLVSSGGCTIAKAFYQWPPSLIIFKGMRTEKKLLNQQG